MNDPRKDFLAHAAFATDKDGEVYRSHLDGYVDASVQPFVVAYYAVALFD